MDDDSHLGMLSLSLRHRYETRATVLGHRCIWIIHHANKYGYKLLLYRYRLGYRFLLLMQTIWKLRETRIDFQTTCDFSAICSICVYLHMFVNSVDTNFMIHKMTHLRKTEFKRQFKIELMLNYGMIFV